MLVLEGTERGFYGASCKCLSSSLQYKVRTLQDLVSLKDSDRRNMLRFLGEEKYDEVMAVLGSFPHITMDTKLQGWFWDTHIANTHGVEVIYCFKLFFF